MNVDLASDAAANDGSASSYRRANDSFADACVVRNWYVVGWSAELGRSPLSRIVCGRRLALFRDSAGAARAIDATCPHRGADLARGEIHGDSLACPFHGIAFDRDGRCTRIPSQAPGAPIPSTLRVGSYPVHEAGGLLWVWPESGAKVAADPEPPEFLSLAAPWRRSISKATLCPGSYLNNLENALDDSHLAFVHRSALPGAPLRVVGYRITVGTDRRSYRGEAAVELDSSDVPERGRASRSGLGTGSRLHDLLGRVAFARLVQMRRQVEYDLSGLVCYTVDYVGGYRDYTFAYFTPADAERTWMTGGIIRNHSLNVAADRFLERFMRRLVEEDVAAMSLLVPEARGPGGLRPPFVVPADRSSYPFRRIYGEALRAEGKSPPWSADAGQTDAA